MRLRPGRRVARAVVVSAAAVTLVAGAAYAPASLDLAPPATPTPTTPSVSGPSEVAVGRAGLVCPGPEQRGMSDSAVPEAAQDVRVEAVTAPEEALPAVAEASAGPAAGEVGLHRLSGEGLGEIEDHGTAEQTSLDEADAVVIGARGSLAPALGGAQIYRGEQEQRLGLSLTPCTAPVEDAWLVAGGGAVGRSERIVLVNPGPRAVDVRVEVLGSASQSDADSRQPPGTVVALGPGQREILLVDALAPGVRSPVVEVTSSPGPVSAFLGDRWLDGSTDAGMQLTAPVAGPATTQVVGGLGGWSVEDTRQEGTSGGGPRETVPVRLRVAVPGAKATVVQVRALTSGGPVRLDSEAAPIEGRDTAELTVRGVPPDAYALEVTSERPVVAAAATGPPQSGEGARDLAWAPGLTALGALGGTPLPQPGGESGVGYSLQLVSPRGGSARVLVQDSEGEIDSEQVRARPGRTWNAELDAAAVWVVPESGEVYASVTARSLIRPRPAKDDVSSSASGRGSGGKGEPVSLVSVLPVPDLAVTRPVLAVVPELP